MVNTVAVCKSSFYVPKSRVAIQPPCLLDAYVNDSFPRLQVRLYTSNRLHSLIYLLLREKYLRYSIWVER